MIILWQSESNSTKFKYFYISVISLIVELLCREKLFNGNGSIEISCHSNDCETENGHFTFTLHVSCRIVFIE